MVEGEYNKKLKSVMLNFNCIYKVNFDNRSPEILEKVSEEFNSLSEFKSGSRNHRGKGFIDFEDDFDIEFILKPPLFDQENSTNTKKWRYEFSISNKNILAKRFRYELYYEGRQEPEYREADIFWIKPCDVLLIKGSEKACEQISKYLTNFINVGFDPIQFDPEFLLWMSYKYQSDGKLNDMLLFEKMDKTRTQGILTNENDIRVKEGQGRMIPIPTLYGLLNEQELSHVGGDFQFKNEYKLNAKLSIDLTMYIYSEHALNGKTYSEKCSLAFPFIIELINIFEAWEKRDYNDDKFPDDKFFDSSLESFQKQIEDSIESINELKEKYNNLRNGKGVEDVT